MADLNIIISLIIALIFMKFIKYMEITEKDTYDTYVIRVRRSWAVYIAFLMICFSAIIIAISDKKIDLTVAFTLAGLLSFFFGIIPLTSGIGFLKIIKEHFFTIPESPISMKIYVLSVFGYLAWSILLLTFRGIEMIHIDAREYQSMFTVLILFLDVIFFLPFVEIWVNKERIKDNQIKAEKKSKHKNTKEASGDA